MAPLNEDGLPKASPTASGLLGGCHIVIPGFETETHSPHLRWAAEL